MNKNNFPYIALALGFVLAVLVSKGSETGAGGKTVLPLLTLLVVCEFGGIVTAIGSYFGIRKMISSGFELRHSLVTISCLVLSIFFIILGIQLWPH